MDQPRREKNGFFLKLAVQFCTLGLTSCCSSSHLNTGIRSYLLWVCPGLASNGIHLLQEPSGGAPVGEGSFRSRKSKHPKRFVQCSESHLRIFLINSFLTCIIIIITHSFLFI